MTLDVYLNDLLVGKLQGSDGVTFTYTSDAHPISLSMPVTEAPYGDAATRNFFTNLFFENTQLDDVVAKHGLDRNDVVGILRYLGKDCPGAISVVPQGSAPGKRPGLLKEDYEAVGDEEDLMQRLQMRRLGTQHKDPSPLAGVQGKIAVTVIDGRLCLPRDNAPTTHILKVPTPAEAGLVAQEYHLLKIAGAIQSQTVVDTEIFEAGGIKGLLVKRYDRHVENGYVDRIHQEDFCQALGLHPLLKYERNGQDPARTFTANAVGTLLGKTQVPAVARRNFLIATLLNLALGNTDNHAKNHSLLYLDRKPVLAPLYDIVPILLDDQVTHDFAFKIGNAERVQDLTRKDIEGFAASIGFKRTDTIFRDFEGILNNIANHIPQLPRPSVRGMAIMLEDQLSVIHEHLDIGPNFPNRDLFPRPL